MPQRSIARGLAARAIFPGQRLAPLLSVLFLGFLRICTRFTLWNPQQAFWQSATAAGTSSRKVKEKGKPPPPLEKNREGRKGRLSSFPSSKRNTATALHNPGRFFFLLLVGNRPSDDRHRQYRQQRPHADHAQRLPMSQQVVPRFRVAAQQHHND
jgi:hypothetical protein